MKPPRCKPISTGIFPAGLGLFLTLVWLGGVPAPAQDANPAPPRPPAALGSARPDEAPAAEDAAGTNDMAQTEDLAPADEQVSTNGAPALTNNTPGGGTRISGRDARERRFRRQRATPGSAIGPGPGDSASGTNGGPTALDYSAFGIVATRNIFNPNRSPGSTGTPGPQRPPTEYLTFVGTMSYEKGVFAFFSGSSSKALKLTDDIAGFKVTSITPDAVKLASGTNEVELRVGMQLRHEEDGPWVPSRSPVAYAANPAPAVASSTDAAASGAESDILKKLMQRREQSNSQ
jgi:hypothetical protein